MRKKLTLIWIAVFIFAAYTLINYKIESNRNHVIYKNISITRDSTLNEVNLNFNKILLKDFLAKEENKISEKYKPFITLNKDVIGWIKIPNTEIDYPVFKGDNNEFYLDHDPYKKSNNHGSIFMDFRNKGVAEELHTILYGHNMKDGSMFADLNKYKDLDFLDKNPIIEFSTLYEDIRWEIFSVYITDTTFDYIRTNFDKTEDRTIFLQHIKEKSKFHRDIAVSEKDTILTLSTCSYEFINARLVIHAKRI
ncbi:class B sortase [Clostridium sp. CS001]|uniref:class B sortase n=1 Tax=Clostridium sp. CS001 TaxID=2880648 RepID=UPI001CF5C140|nr:class B sortase [Clostridium sp. CS001]MCB2289420.1 class B sortase [Clostridium sp. CS001]